MSFFRVKDLFYYILNIQNPKYQPYNFHLDCLSLFSYAKYRKYQNNFINNVFNRIFIQKNILTYVCTWSDCINFTVLHFHNFLSRPKKKTYLLCDTNCQLILFYDFKVMFFLWCMYAFRSIKKIISLLLSWKPQLAILYV